MAQLLGVLFAALVVACGNGGGPAPTLQATSAPSATPSEGIGPPSPQAARIVEHMRHLSDEIGIRLAGTDAADEAARYAQEQFESWGYNVEMQDFSDARPEVIVYARVAVRQPEDQSLHSIVFRGSSPGSVSGELVDAGTGEDADFSAEAQGAIVLIQREDVMFKDMAARAVAHGAIGLIVANNKEGLFKGTIDPPADLPAVSISQADGEALRDQLASGPVELSIEVPAAVEGTNVIARPPAGLCRTMSGAHYDTVPWAPGGVDNASGSAMVLELARAAAAAQLQDHCFVLFSGEEEGLVGSSYFVSNMSQQERDDLIGYVNYDVVAGGTTINVVGDQDLGKRTVELGTQAGADIVFGQLPANASSDFASFQKAGLSAVMFTVDDLGVLHTEDDTFDFAQMHTEALQPIADTGFMLIQDLLRPAAP